MIISGIGTLVAWAMLIGWFAFDEVPDHWTLGGTALVVGAGLYAVHRERTRHAASATAGAAGGR